MEPLHAQFGYTYLVIQQSPRSRTPTLRALLRSAAGPPGAPSPETTAREAMAANGKVAVDKLKIGATVSIKLKDSGSCEGAVYTVDPVTKTVVLFSAAEKPVTQDSRDVRLVPEHAIDSIKVVKQPDAKDKKALVAPLPAIDVAACKKRESEAYEAMEAAMAMLNPNASAAGQACFDALSKTLDCSWSGMISAF